MIEISGKNVKSAWRYEDEAGTEKGSDRIPLVSVQIASDSEMEQEQLEAAHIAPKPSPVIHLAKYSFPAVPPED